MSDIGSNRVLSGGIRPQSSQQIIQLSGLPRSLSTSFKQQSKAHIQITRQPYTLIQHNHNHNPLPVRLGVEAPINEPIEFDCAIPGDEGVLLGRTGPSPLMIS